MKIWLSGWLTGALEMDNIYPWNVGRICSTTQVKLPVIEYLESSLKILQFSGNEKSCSVIRFVSRESNYSRVN